MSDDKWSIRTEMHIDLDPEPDQCGLLPSGETCSLDPQHDGKHMKLQIRTIPTDFQEEVSQ